MFGGLLAYKVAPNSGKVYDVTRFLKYHPGRKAQLMRGAGVDSSELFDKVSIEQHKEHLHITFNQEFGLD